MSRSDEAKESCDCSLFMSLYGCIPVLQQLLHVSLVLARKASGIVGAHIPLPSKALLKEALVSPSYYIKESTMTNILFFKFHFLMIQLANSFS